MNVFSPDEYIPAEGLLIRIVDNDQVQTIDYQQATAAHQRSLWWGTAVGYRAMQVAAIALSKQRLWQREGLSIVSGHPGPGVLDSLNFVTHCGDNDRILVMENPNCVSRCNSEMKFEWWVSDTEQTVHIALREDFVPQAFYQLIDRRVYDEKREDDDALFELYKVNLSSKIWVAPLDESFSYDYQDLLAPGELPKGHAWSQSAA